MKYCPKCRKFYDDELLRFCLKDGVPLVEINPNQNLWSEGTNYLCEVKKQVIRETRRKQLKKILTMFVTTILTIMIISVIVLKSWIYLNKPENETTNKEVLLSGNPEIENKPEIAEIPEVSETTEIVEKIPEKTKPTPKIENTPTNENKSNKNTNTNTNTNKNTNTNTNTNTKKKKNTDDNNPPNDNNPPKETCTDADRLNMASRIKGDYAAFWEQSIQNQKDVLFEKYAKTYPYRVEKKINVNKNGISVDVDNKCKTASANVPFIWTIISPILNKPISDSKTFSCHKSKIWTCP